MNKHAQNLRAALALHPKEVDALLGTGLVEKAAAEIDRLEQDAARYRWLRARDLASIQEGGLFAGKTPDNIVLNGKDLDIAIDEAMLL